LEALIRLSAFVGVLVLMVIWEYAAPRRPLRYRRSQRWPINFALSIFGMLLIRLTVGGVAYVTAVTAMTEHAGLLNQLILPSWLSILLTLLVLDLAIYGQHIASHRWKWLWRLHKVHHTDLDFDVSTGIRFHPIEIVVSMIYKVFIIYVIGANPIAVIAFEVILSATALFNHGNVFIPINIDRWLRVGIVTPDMHRVHHSTTQRETDSNFGFSISIWDRLFGTYIDQPALGHDKMIIGLAQYRYSPDVGIKRLLVMPFQRQK